MLMRGIDNVPADNCAGKLPLVLYLGGAGVRGVTYDVYSHVSPWRSIVDALLMLESDDLRWLRFIAQSVSSGQLLTRQFSSCKPLPGSDPYADIYRTWKRQTRRLPLLAAEYRSAPRDCPTEVWQVYR